MREADLHFTLEADPSLPLYLRICRAMARAIETGALKPGDSLPGSRVLAEQFGVNRNTIVLALSILESQGWVEVQPQRGTFVAHPSQRGVQADWEEQLLSAVSEGTPTPFNWTISGEDAPPSLPKGGINLGEIAPDIRLFPAIELGRYYKKAMGRHHGGPLTPQDPKGQPDLRKALASWLARRRGLYLGFESLVTTTGLPMAIELLVKATLWNFGVVAMETPGPPEIRKVLESQRIAIIGIPVDGEGMQVGELAEHLEAGVPIRLIILSAACQHPTGARLSEARRQALLGLVARHQVVVAEDDGLAVWYRDAPPPLPLAHFDRTGKVVTFGSFGHWLAPGIHSGFIYARGSVANRLAGLKKTSHLATDHVLESALASLFTRDALQSHIRHARTHYASRLQKAADLIASWPGFQVEPSGGGLGLWIRLPDHLDVRHWQQACSQQGISLPLGRDYGEPHGEHQHVYLALAQFDLEELEAVLTKLASCLPSFQQTPGPRQFPTDLVK